MKSIKIKGLLATALLLPLVANAVPITGNIGIGGSLLPTCSAGGACDMGIADGLDFTTPGLVLFADGDFASTLGFGDVVAMTDFTFDPFAGVDPLWSAGGFDFALNTLVIVGQNANLLELRGTGMISSAGYDDTMGTWSFSADIATGAAEFAWSSTTAPVLAPEPGMLLLIGMGLIGGLGARRLTRS